MSLVWTHLLNLLNMVNHLVSMNFKFEKVTGLEKRFDLVVLKNVLEHVIEPLSFLTQINNNYMQSGSLLQIEFLMIQSFSNSGSKIVRS